MNSRVLPTQTNVWYLTRCYKPNRLEGTLQADVVIVGAGMAGLSAADGFAQAGKKVIVLDKNFIGSGATGASSGFITNNAELSFTDLATLSDTSQALNTWSFISQGAEKIHKNIIDRNFSCGYRKDTGLLLASTQKAFKKIEKEYQALVEHGYSSNIFNAEQIPSVLGSTSFFGAMTYPDSFGIDAYAYVWALHDDLVKKGVQFFQDSAVLNIVENTVFTRYGQVQAEHVVVCVDRFLPDFNIVPESIYSAQNTILASSQLTDKQIQKLFPSGAMMAWDTQLMYNFFRLTSDNRLLLGGTSLLSVYQTNQGSCASYVRRKLMRYWDQNFSQIPVDFSYEWSGLIGVSKDLRPLMGCDKNNQHVFFISGCAGLSIAAAAGYYAVQHCLENRNDMTSFDPYRSFRIQGFAQKILGKKLSFAICNAVSQQLG